MASPAEKQFAAEFRQAALKVGALECKLCTWVGWKLGRHAATFHGLTKERYLAKYPGSVMTMDRPPGAPSGDMRHFELTTECDPCRDTLCDQPDGHGGLHKAPFMSGVAVW
jgi:hypothetical protein